MTTKILSSRCRSFSETPNRLENDRYNLPGTGYHPRYASGNLYTANILYHILLIEYLLLVKEKTTLIFLSQGYEIMIWSKMPQASW